MAQQCAMSAGYAGADEAHQKHKERIKDNGQRT